MEASENKLRMREEVQGSNLLKLRILKIITIDHPRKK